jgi:hypothetical protein
MRAGSCAQGRAEARVHCMLLCRQRAGGMQLRWGGALMAERASRRLLMMH